MWIYVVRHGRTNWNKNERWQGEFDIPLDKTGISQAEEAAKKLKHLKICNIYTSPLSRAYKTAEIIGKNNNVPITVFDSLREIQLGQWAGLSLKEMAEKDESDFSRWYAGECFSPRSGAESYASLQKRAYESFINICKNQKGPALFVVHGTWFRTLLCKVVGLPLKSRNIFEIDNVSLSILDYNRENNRIRIVSINAGLCCR